mgnify:CR=1 FL=1
MSKIASIGRKRINGKNYSIRISEHFFNRMENRKLEIRDILNILNSIDFFTLSKLVRDIGSEVAVIDYDKKLTLFFGIKVNKINFITGLQGVDNYIKDNTKIVEINKEVKDGNYSR